MISTSRILRVPTQTLVAVVTLFLLTACFSVPTPPQPPAAPPAPPAQAPVEEGVTLDVLIDPPQGARWLVNPKPDGRGRFARGTTVTIDILVNDGWEIDEWRGPFVSLADTKATINMDDNQTVLVQLAREETSEPSQGLNAPQPAITPAPVQPAPAPPATPVVDGLVAWWTADGNADDVVGDNHGTLHGDAILEPGIVGQSFNFHGIDDYVQIYDSDDLDLGYSDYTIVAWIKTASTNYHGRIFSKGSSSCISGYMMRMDGNQSSKILLENAFDGSCKIQLTSNTTVNDNRWHFVAGVVDRKYGARIYIDGKLDSSQKLDTSVYDLSNDRNPRIGSNDVGDYVEPFQGNIDEIAIYNRALTPEEIRSIYEAVE